MWTNTVQPGGSNAFPADEWLLQHPAGQQRPLHNLSLCEYFISTFRVIPENSELAIRNLILAVNTQK